LVQPSASSDELSQLSIAETYYVQAVSASVLVRLLLVPRRSALPSSLFQPESVSASALSWNGAVLLSGMLLVDDCVLCEVLAGRVPSQSVAPPSR
jgi:hypothetical protein